MMLSTSSYQGLVDQYRFVGLDGNNNPSDQGVKMAVTGVVYVGISNRNNDHNNDNTDGDNNVVTVEMDGGATGLSAFDHADPRRALRGPPAHDRPCGQPHHPARTFRTLILPFSRSS
jgi:hypothetical protein